jgi:xanthine/uracil permease
VAPKIQKNIMKKWLIRVALVLVGLILGVVVVGFMLPVEQSHTIHEITLN